MALDLIAGWDFARLVGVVVPFRFQLDDDGPAVNVDFSTGTYSHRSFTTVPKAAAYVEFASFLKTALDAASSGAGSYTVSFNASTLAYTISYSAGNFSLTFNSDAEQVFARRLLGFTGNKSGAASYVSDAVPWFAVRASSTSKALDTLVRERPGVARQRIASDGTSYGLSRKAGAEEQDFEIWNEPRALVKAEDAAAGAPFTFEHFFKHVRCTHPFGVFDGSYSPERKTVHMLRDDGATFDDQVHQMQWGNYAGRWIMRLRTLYLGKIP